MRVEIWCRYLLKVESCVMLNVFCHYNSRIYQYENFSNTKTKSISAIRCCFLTKFWNLIAFGTLYRPCKFQKKIRITPKVMEG